ncbi:MAG TPA: transglycosylase family protein [Solirubrobacterales bacterium]
MLLAVCAVPVAEAADLGDLRAKVDRAQGEAAELASEIRATQSQFAAARQEAAVAAAREEQLTALLASGRERAAELEAKVGRTRHRLALERRRLRRARRALAHRLVGIYKAGAPSAAGVVLGSVDYDQLATRTEYLERIEDSDRELAERVEQVRDAVRRGLRRVSALKARVDAHNERLAAARSEISAVRASAEAAASQLASLAAARQAGLAELKSRIGGWVSDIEEAEAASRASAEETVGRWLGGPYSIPAYIVMCESGGDYGALNPSSGAGGAYQILPSTWALYGGRGAPHEASKAEQDRIAAEIWSDSGGSAWVCTG